MQINDISLAKNVAKQTISKVGVKSTLDEKVLAEMMRRLDEDEGDTWKYQAGRSIFGDDISIGTWQNIKKHLTDKVENIIEELDVNDFLPSEEQSSDDDDDDDDNDQDEQGGEQGGGGGNEQEHGETAPASWVGGGVGLCVRLRASCVVVFLVSAPPLWGRAARPSGCEACVQTLRCALPAGPSEIMPLASSSLGPGQLRTTRSSSATRSSRAGTTTTRRSRVATTTGQSATPSRSS
jgi:hypothetical protein